MSVSLLRRRLMWFATPTTPSAKSSMFFCSTNHRKAPDFRELINMHKYCDGEHECFRSLNEHQTKVIKMSSNQKERFVCKPSSKHFKTI